VASTAARRTLLVLEAVTSFGAIAAGSLLVIVPDGPVSMGDDALAELGYHSWRTPGLFLILFIGVLPLVAIFADGYRHRLAGLAHFAFGGALITWIVVQVTRIGFDSALQPAFLVVGLVVVGLAWRAYRAEILDAFRRPV
jgi:hypothetical protein